MFERHEAALLGAVGKGFGLVGGVWAGLGMIASSYADLGTLGGVSCGIRKHINVHGACIRANLQGPRGKRTGWPGIGSSTKRNVPAGLEGK